MARGCVLTKSCRSLIIAPNMQAFGGFISEVFDFAHRFVQRPACAAARDLWKRPWLFGGNLDACVRPQHVCVTRISGQPAESPKAGAGRRASERRSDGFATQAAPSRKENTRKKAGASKGRRPLPYQAHIRRISGARAASALRCGDELSYPIVSTMRGVPSGFPSSAGSVPSGAKTSSHKPPGSLTDLSLIHISEPTRP